MSFSSCRRRRARADFSGGTISSNGGALLLREVDRRLGLTARVARCRRAPPAREGSSRRGDDAAPAGARARVGLRPRHPAGRPGGSRPRAVATSPWRAPRRCAGSSAGPSGSRSDLEHEVVVEPVPAATRGACVYAARNDAPHGPAGDGPGPVPMPEPSPAAALHRGGGHPQHPHRDGATVQRLPRPSPVPVARTTAYRRIGPSFPTSPESMPRARPGASLCAARRRREANPLPMTPAKRFRTLASVSRPPSVTSKLSGKDRTTPRNQEPRASCNIRASDPRELRVRCWRRRTAHLLGWAPPTEVQRPFRYLHRIMLPGPAAGRAARVE